MLIINLNFTMDFIFLEGDASQTASSLWSMPLMMGLIFLVMYFFMIRPQQKKQKAETAFREGIKKGDKVMSIGGIYGKVATVYDKTVLVEVDNNMKLLFDKTAIRATPETAEEVAELPK